MNRLFNTFFDSPTAGQWRRTSIRRWIPAMDLVENENEYVLKADLPGLSEGDVNIEVEDNVLQDLWRAQVRARGAQGRLSPRGARIRALLRGR